MQTLSAAYIAVCLRYMRIIVHTFLREKFRKMLYRTHPGFPAQFPLPSSEEQLSRRRWGWWRLGVPCALLASYLRFSH